MSGVTFERVSKVYGAERVVDDLSLEVADGEFVVLLGPSGCGKTTSLRMVAGFVHPSAGDIRIGGERVTHLAPRHRHVGMVFQDYALFPNLTVAENVAFALEERGDARAAIEQRVAELLRMVRLENLRERYPSQMSGGQQQRVGIARALAASPRVLLMDEPLGALDLKLRQAMQAELRRIHQELRVTTILVTHDQEEAMGLADRIAVMAQGRLQQIGTPDAIYSRPANAFVADFIGKINFLPGIVADSQPAGAEVRLVGSDALVRVPARPDLRAGARVTVAVRPERLHIGGAADAGLENAVPGTVESRQFLGNLVRVTVRLADGRGVVAESGAADSLAPGAAVRVGWRIVDSLVFAGDDTLAADAVE